MNKTLTIALMLSTAGVARADLRAIVVDGTTLAPIPDAVVRVAGYAHVADRDGAVVLPGDTAVDVQMSAAGYETSTQLAEPGDEPTLLLMFTVGAVEVVEVRGHAPRSVTDGSYTLGTDEIRNLPGGRNDALAAVRSLPGIGSAPPMAGGRLVIRGGAPHDSLLTIDGVPVPFVYHAFDQSTILPVSMIGAMSYSPGGFGVDEGRATSGNVGLITNDEPASRASATATASLTDISATAATPLSRAHHLSLSGGVRRSTVDMIMPLAMPDDSPVSFTTYPRYHDAQLRLDWVPKPNDRVSLLAFTSFDKLGIVNTMPDNNDLPADFSTDTQFSRLIASWKHEVPGARNRFVAAAGAGQFHATYDSVQYLDDTHVLALVRDDLSVDVMPRVRLRAGVLGQLEKHELDARTVVIPSDGLGAGESFHDLPIKMFAETYNTSYGAAYAAADVEPTTSTRITTGVRLDYFARIDAAVLEPRIEIAQRSGTMTLRASAGRYARDHAQAQALDTTLEPELATQVTGGTEIALAEGLSARATVYYTAREQLAVDDPMAASSATVNYASTGAGSSGGIDLLLRLHRDDLFAWLAYSYGKTSRSDDEDAETMPTPYDQTHALTALASYQHGNWRFGARFQLATGLPYTDVVGGTYSEDASRYLPILGAANGARYPDVVHLDLRIERVWKTKHVDVAAFIDFANVFRSERVHRYRYNDDFSVREPVTEYVPLPSIGIRAEL